MNHNQLDEARKLIGPEPNILDVLYYKNASDAFVFSGAYSGVEEGLYYLHNAKEAFWFTMQNFMQVVLFDWPEVYKYNISNIDYREEDVDFIKPIFLSRLLVGVFLINIFISSIQNFITKKINH